MKTRFSLSSRISAMEENLSQLSIDVEQKQKELEEERQKIIIITQERDHRHASYLLWKMTSVH